MALVFKMGLDSAAGKSFSKSHASFTLFWLLSEASGMTTGTSNSMAWSCPRMLIKSGKRSRVGSIEDALFSGMEIVLPLIMSFFLLEGAGFRSRDLPTDGAGALLVI